MKYTVIGAARSGLAAAKLASRLGHDVFLTEAGPEDKFASAIDSLNALGIKYEFGANSDKALDCDCIISSPGVPPHAPIIKKAEDRNILIISELEFARRQCLNNPLIGITGTNGKTTTTALTAYILNHGGRHAVEAGNIGMPLSALVPDLKPDTVIVAELSSYQLDRVECFRPDVAVLLNITPDHLGYHGSMENYITAKFKIFVRQIEKDLLICNADDAALSAQQINNDAQKALFSLNPVDFGIYTRDGRLCIRYPQQHEEEEIMLLDEIRLPGVHNVYNSMAAALAARAFEISNENIRDSLMKFQGVEHRLEYVRTLDGADYVNDSKATNINATWYGLSSYKKPIVWIAGGRGDSNNYADLDRVVDSNVKSIVAIGEEADEIFNHFCLTKRCIKAGSLQEAVEAARQEAEPGDVVVFTPACKSFDMFMNYEQRGEIFKDIVNKM